MRLAKKTIRGMCKRSDIKEDLLSFSGGMGGRHKNPWRGGEVPEANNLSTMLWRNGGDIRKTLNESIPNAMLGGATCFCTP